MIYHHEMIPNGSGSDYVAVLHKRIAELEADCRHYAEDCNTALNEVAELEAENKRLMAVFEAAHGLCCGVDWNKGTHAILHGYRKKLIDAVRKFREIE